ncbi:ABC transporter permease [Candidatus Accumulibacter vicinus]|uniref:Glutathione transport system permease protein GsiD n=1 Tax=Candidatus Accumulibacter vicinus TaxID=2954382 RepID=A0A084Y5W5_9PROT|nr:ABC transporter permease [Candidatus Accumulibacter vicinus]KFB70109.1 MAG: Glutathione transport system permease protein GsiD [Candidatus Accumulibacter vicinus]
MAPVVLWSDGLIWLLVLAASVLGWLSRRNPLWRAAWQRVGRSRSGMASATVLLVFVCIGLLDSLHYRPRLEESAGRGVGTASEKTAVYSVEVLSLLDFLLTPLRTRTEKTYSEPLATRAHAKESIKVRDADGQLRQSREYPRLKHGGAHLGADEARRDADVAERVLRALGLAMLVWWSLAAATAALLARRQHCSHRQAWRRIWHNESDLACNAVLAAIAGLLLCGLPLAMLATDYHVFGTDKVGQDVLYQVLKSIRTALVIGLVTTLVMLPVAIFLGVVAGYFRGWVDDLIQYLYTTLSSIPGVLLIAAAVLMMQVLIDTHPQWFATAAERADLRLLALCFILGVTSWTGLCRLLRGETLKLRELEYIQAAQAFGVSDLRIIARHIFPNLMHIVIIALVMDFSSLVLAEAVLSYVGIGVDPTMISFGTMINNARLELAREPMVWWSLAAAFVFMFTLVLAANLLADAVRDAFDPRLTGSA